MVPNSGYLGYNRVVGGSRQGYWGLRDRFKTF